MALSDYLLCCVCGGKAIYDADWFERVADADATVRALCGGCSKTYAIVARVAGLPADTVSIEVSAEPPRRLGYRVRDVQGQEHVLYADVEGVVTVPFPCTLLGFAP